MWPMAPKDDPMRYIRKRKYGGYEIRMWCRLLGVQVSYGRFKHIKDAQRERDRVEITTYHRDQLRIYKPVKPRVSRPRKKTAKDLYSSNI